jgi:polyhydroxybutyrate depolymerase
MDTLIRYNNADGRFFCTGLSRGGIFSLFLASRLSARIKTIAPVCAAITVSIIDNYSFQHATPVLMINGTADPLILYNGGEGKFTAASAIAGQNNMLPAEQLMLKLVALNHCNSQPDTSMRCPMSTHRMVVRLQSIVTRAQVALWFLSK